MDLNGTYRGFSPTDESGVVLGELEVTITDDTVSFRFATGLKVESDEAPRSELTEMSDDEIAMFLNPVADLTAITVYKLGEDGPVFLFLQKCLDDAPEAPAVMVLRFVSDEVDEIFGPSCLFTPTQVAAGHFDRAVAEIEAEQNDPGVIPRLVNNGLRG